jgi:hypothetical protein
MATRAALDMAAQAQQDMLMHTVDTEAHIHVLCVCTRLYPPTRRWSGGD